MFGQRPTPPMTRQVRRAMARHAAGYGLHHLLGTGLSRKARRFGSRAYANAAWRHRHNLPARTITSRGLTLPIPWKHRYSKLILNHDLVIWTMNEAKL